MGYVFNFHVKLDTFVIKMKNFHIEFDTLLKKYDAFKFLQVKLGTLQKG